MCVMSVGHLSRTVSRRLGVAQKFEEVRTGCKLGSLSATDDLRLAEIPHGSKLNRKEAWDQTLGVEWSTVCIRVYTLHLYRWICRNMLSV